MALKYRLEIRLWILGSCCLLAAPLAMAWMFLPSGKPQVPANADHPSLQVDMSHRDLGTVYPGDTVSTHYRLENIGNVELVISDLHSSCGCAPATIDTNPVPPGGSAEIKISFDTPLAAGLVGHSVMFHTNDPDHPDMALTFQVWSRRAIEPAPPNVFTGAILCGKDVSHDLELCSTYGSPFEVKKHLASVPWIHIQTLEHISNRHKYRVTIDSHAPLGEFSESVIFYTSCSRQEEVVVPVRGQVVSGFAISPASLLLRSAPVRSTVDAKLLISSFENLGEMIGSLVVQDKEWQVVSWKKERILDTKMLLRIQLRLPSTTGYKRTVLILKPSGAGPAHKIPLSCLVTAAEPTKR